MAARVLRFMGLSGWLYVLFLIVSGVAYAPYNGGHWLLLLEWALVLVIWLAPRFHALWSRYRPNTRMPSR
ncbi:MAG: hypothetical protein ACRYG8_23335 [Janthinobacterium lividum]